MDVSEPKKKKPGRPKKHKKNEPEQPENYVSSSCQVLRNHTKAEIQQPLLSLFWQRFLL